MRIIAGTARGRRLETREGMEVRPTPERVKEALFNILQFQIEGRRVLDLFAGSGQLGLEALSRGAKEAVFVDESRESMAVVRRNIASLHMEDRCQTFQCDYAAFLLRKQQPFDIVFLDPPYRSGRLQKALELASGVMSPGGVMIAEHPEDEEVPEQAGSFRRGRSYRYGKIYLTVYRHEDFA